MQFTDLNPRGGIGASATLLELEGFRILVDAGLNPKLAGSAALPRLDPIQSIPLDFILLTHTHLDHLGALPVAARHQPDCPIIMSPASDQLFRRMLRNSVTIMEKQRAETGQPPLYRRREVEKLARRSFPLIPGQPRFFSGRDGQKLTLTLHHAGHIPGACGAMLEIRHRKIFLTGDVQFARQTILSGASFPSGKVDTLVIETTRGATTRPTGKSRETEVERFLDSIRHTISHGGQVLIPAFALGRLQEILAILYHARRAGKLPKVPIFASGLGLDLVDHFDALAPRLPQLHFRRAMLHELGVRKLQDAEAGTGTGAAIFVVSSGMMVPQTPSYFAASHMIEEPRNRILFVGYCDPDTPGGQLLDRRHGGKFVFDALRKVTTVRAAVEQFDLSAHADREELMEWGLACDPRAVVLTHGDPGARRWFAEKWRELRPNVTVHDPEPLKPRRI